MYEKVIGHLHKPAIALLTAVTTLLLSACAQSGRDKSIDYISQKYAVPEDNQLIVYTSHKEEVYLPIIREFESRTGIWVDVHAGGTTEMMRQAREASENGECDIMFGGGIESFEAQKDFFMPYKSESSEALDRTYAAFDNSWTVFTELPIVFIYNKKLVRPSEVPRKWSDLFDEKWKGQIAFADIKNSGTSYTILFTMEQILGEESKELVPRFYEQLGGNILDSSGEVIPYVSDGTFLIGITLEETAKKYMALGYDIALIYPEDGTSAIPDGCAMVKNAPHSYNAGKFIDFVVGYDTQKYAMENFYRRPVRKDVELTKDFGEASFIRLDIKESAAKEEEVFTIWNELEGGED